MRFAAFAAVSVSLLAWTTSRPAEASPEDLFGYGDRAPAMGGLGAATSEGFEAAYTNPALLSRIRRLKLTLGYQAATFDLKATGPGLPGPISYDAMRSVVIGADVPIPLRGVLTDRIGAGLALSTPTDLVVRGHLPYPEVPQYPLLPDRAQSVSVRAGLGMDVGWGLRVGAGFAALAELVGNATVATDATGHVGAKVQDQLVATYAPTFGLSFDLPLHDHETTRLGITYRGALAAHFDVAIDATRLSSLNLPILTIAGLAQYDPAELEIDAARSFGPVLLAAGMTYKRWQDYPGLLAPTLTCPADDPTCGALTPPTIKYADTFVPRVGVEYTIDAARSVAMHLRAGGFYEASPMPHRLHWSQAFDPTLARAVDLPTRYFDASRVAITIGYGAALRYPLPPITVDLFAQAHVLLSRTMEADAQDTGNGPLRAMGTASGTVLVGGLLAGVSF